MTPEKFLNDCETQVHDKRCRIPAPTLAYLCSLAGSSATAVRFWRRQDTRLITCESFDIKALIAKARGARIAA